MRVHSYVVARDYGFAPNPFFGVCTLATCKPVIRRAAGVDDWVVGTGSKMYGLTGRLVFVMHVQEILSFDEYWSDRRFRSKRPSLNGSEKQAYGDNIYRRDKRGVWRQEPSHHSYADGSTNDANVRHDTSAPHVLVSDEFSYWGAVAPIIPKRFRAPEDLCALRGHKSNFSDGFVRRVDRWFGGLERGYLGPPMEWSRMRGTRRRRLARAR